jgi:hypothetical protein
VPLRSLCRRREDRGATDPILVIAAIAVSLVLLVGGSFTVSGLIANAKNSNAKNDLALVATAEAATQASGSSYLAWAITSDGSVSGDKNLDGNTLNQSKVGFTTTPGVAVNVNANANGWVAMAASSTGMKFFRSSKQPTLFTGSIPASAYAAGLTDPSVAAPYNATKDCSNAASQWGYLSDGDYTALTPTVVGNTLTVTLTATGTSLCSWAKSGNLNLGGDSVTSAPNPDTGNVYDVRIGNDWGATDPVTVQSLRMSLTASGTDLSANRTVTITADLANLSPYTSGGDLQAHFMDTGAFITIVTSNGSRLSFSHYGPNMGE